MKDLSEKLKNEAFVKKLEDSGVKVDSLKKSIQEKQNSKTIEK